MSAIIRREQFAACAEGMALPGGEYVIALNEPAVLTDARRIPCPEPLRFPVMTVGTGRGRCIAGQSQVSLATWEYVEAEDQWFDRGPNAGERPCLYLPDGTLVIERGGPDHPTEGWAGTNLEGQPVRVVRADHARDLYEVTEIGPFAVGQLPDGGIGLLFDGKRYLVEPGDVHSIWLVLGANGVLAIATRKLAQNETVLLWVDANRIAELPSAPTTPPIVIPPIEPPIIVPPKEKDPMQFTERQQQIVEQLFDRHPEIFLFRGDGEDDVRRKGAKMIAEQFRFEFGEDWGWKSNHGNTENDAPGKDAIAKKRGPYTPGRQLLYIFDMFNGTTRKPNPVISSVPEEESNQFFVPVEPVNHLGAVVEEPKPDEPKPDEPKPDADLAALVQKLADQVERNSAQLKVSAQREADFEKRIAAIEKPGTGTGGGTGGGAVPADLAKQIAAELFKLLSKLGQAA